MVATISEAEVEEKKEGRRKEEIAVKSVVGWV